MHEPKIETIEDRIRFWRENRWPKPDPQDVWDANKLGGEAGEVLEAVTKIHEGRATLDDLADEMGDVLIAMSVLAGRHGWTLDGLRRRRWIEVQER